jgi:hypothetical protein
MIIVNIIGGLGNQMFQFAFAYAFTQKRNVELKLDTSGFLSYELRNYQLDKYVSRVEIAPHADIQKIKYKKENLLSLTLRKLFKKHTPLSESYYKEPFFQFDNVAFNKQGDVYFEGYWQSEKYFHEYRDDLLKILTLRDPVHALTQSYQEAILACNSVSIHIRRGDYVADAKTNSVHGACDLDYYQRAVAFIKRQVTAPHSYIFSDDLSWAKDNLDFIENITFVELDANTSDHQEMWLMSLCQHNIIANSSFSWWGAWLNQHPDKIVIAPQRWFVNSAINTIDLIPESWVRL